MVYRHKEAEALAARGLFRRAANIYRLQAKELGTNDHIENALARARAFEREASDLRLERLRARDPMNLDCDYTVFTGNYCGPQTRGFKY
jgi:hypothetical protein